MKHTDYKDSTLINQWFFINRSRYVFPFLVFYMYFK